MRSRAEALSPRTRQALEWLLHALALGAVLFALWRAMNPVVRTSAIVAGESDLTSSLAAATRGDADAVHANLDLPPSPASRAWMRALRRAGVTVGWSAVDHQPLAIDASAEPSPSGGVRVDVIGGERAVTLNDAGGVLDTISSSVDQRRIWIPAATGSLGATPVSAKGAANRAATIAAPIAPPIKSVLVIGRANWESKFLVAALEEAGWRVESRLRVAPNVVVHGDLPSSGTLDTARFAAVIALDSSANGDAPSLVRFVGQGGGLIAAGEAMTLGSLRALMPLRELKRSPGLPGALASPDPRRAFGAWTGALAGSDAIPLERRNGQPTIAAWRVGPGRAMAIGYEDTWRWRMAGAEGSVAAHRDWWSRAVGSVAYTPAMARDAANVFAPTDPAPYAATVAALGAPTSAATASATPLSDSAWRPLIFLLMAITLLAEWASRRLRGAP